MISARHYALAGATTVSLIYGLTFTIAKDVMPAYIEPYGFILLRVAGATLLFWLTGIFSVHEKIALTDFPRIAAAAFFGVALNMLTFFKGLSLTSPISASVIMVTTPIIVLILSAIMLRERISARRAAGIIIGLAGTALLILNGKTAANAPDAPWGNFLVFANAASYGFYLIIVKKLMDRYNAFTFVKWIYLFGLLMVLPFGWNELSVVSWQIIPEGAYWKIGFVVLFSTFFTYLLNLLSMRKLSPVTISVFIYLQPLFAAIFAISVNKDVLTWVKLTAAALIFAGVFLVTRKKKPMPEAVSN